MQENGGFSTALCIIEFWRGKGGRGRGQKEENTV